MSSPFPFFPHQSSITFIIFLFSITSTLYGIELKTPYVHSPACDLHQSDSYGSRSSDSVLPQSFKDEDDRKKWLYPTIEEVKYYFEIGFKNCEAHMKKHTFSTNFAQHNSDPNTWSGEGQGKCRGTDSLYA